MSFKINTAFTLASGYLCNKDTVHYCTVEYTKAHPCVEDLHTECTPIMRTNSHALTCEQHIHIFENSELEGSYVKDLLHMNTVLLFVRIWIHLEGIKLLK